MDTYRVRLESFGATVYNTRTLSYFFIGKTQFQILQSLMDTSHKYSILPMVENEFINHEDFDRLMGELANGATIKLKHTPEPLAFDSLSAPIRIYFEICLSCQGHCEYCLNDAGSARPGELSTLEAKQTIRNFARDGVFEVRLTGGEPTTRPDFYEVANEVKENDLNFSLNSNLLVSQDTLIKLIDLRPGLLITSLDASEEAHSLNRGLGYDLICRNIGLLRQADIPLRINCMMSTITLPYIEEFIDRFAPAGCGFCFILKRPVGRARADQDYPKYEDLIPVVEMINQKQQDYPNSYFSTSFHVVMKRDQTIGNINLTGCNAIQKSFNVNSNGEVLPCAFLYEMAPDQFSLGNIRDYDYSTLEIWRKSRQLRELRQQSSDCNKRCINCLRFNKDCLGSCVFMNIYSESNNLPDYYCQNSLDAFCSHEGAE